MRKNIIKLPNNKYVNLDTVHEFYILHKVIRPNRNYQYNTYEIVLNGSVAGCMYFSDRKCDDTMKDYYKCKEMICKYLEVEDMEVIDN